MNILVTGDVGILGSNLTVHLRAINPLSLLLILNPENPLATKPFALSLSKGRSRFDIVFSPEQSRRITKSGVVRTISPDSHKPHATSRSL